MNNLPPPPSEPSGPVIDQAGETARPVVAAPATVPEAASTGDEATLVSDHPDVPHPAVAGLQRIGNYTVIKQIGEGGMGAVYLAEDARLGRKVAIKTMKPALAANKPDRDRFEREARAAAAVEHENIVPILHIGEAVDGTPFIVMPFLQGETLAARLTRAAAVPLSLLLRVAGEVAEGLAAAHAKKLIHRDIKPANIWLEGDLSAPDEGEQIRRGKILDFGLARSVDKEDVQITASGVILGPPAFMAPEQARGEKVNPRADLFSLGVVLYRVATGRLPFTGPTAVAVLIAVNTHTPPPVRTLAPNLPRALADLIDQLMRKDPAERPRTAAEVAAAVRKMAAGAKTAPDFIIAPPGPTAPARRRAWVLAGAVFLLGLVPLVWRLASPTETPPADNDVPIGPPRPVGDGVREHLRRQLAPTADFIVRVMQRENPQLKTISFGEFALPRGSNSNYAHLAREELIEAVKRAAKAHGYEIAVVDVDGDLEVMANMRYAQGYVRGEERPPPIQVRFTFDKPTGTLLVPGELQQAIAEAQVPGILVGDPVVINLLLVTLAAGAVWDGIWSSCVR